ncbi:hypothetical protein KAU08_02365, partial [bacterium]|nr:hypothetical protein [bacterium]
MKTDTEKAAFVPMNVEYQPAWLTWVASVTSCLKSLRIDCDLVDVAGVSGYAFYMSIHFELCPSGPTVVPMGRLLFGLTTLGRTTLNYQSVDIEMNEPLSDKARDPCKYAYDLASREISEGRPCVIWGSYVPEYAVAYGVEDGTFHVKSFKECLKEEQPPIPYDKISAPGGPYILAFPNPT